jgi:hypothetical protein
MTALRQYARLEAEGRWRETPEAAPRDVVVSFGKSSLVLSDLGDRPLTHWSLDAISVLEAEGQKARLSPAGYPGEVLEIDDAEMLRAIRLVGAEERARATTRARRWRLAGPVLLTGLVVLGLAEGPALLRNAAARSVPLAEAEAFGARLLAGLESRSGLRACPGGAPGEALMSRLFPGGGQRLVLLPLGGRPVAALPGGILVVDPALPGELNEPGSLAGYLALAGAEAKAALPLAPALEAGPLHEVANVLLGRPPGEAMATAALDRITGAADLPAASYDAEARSLLLAAGIDPRPFARELVRIGSPMDRVQAYDRPPALDVSPALEDQDWVALQDICEG